MKRKAIKLGMVCLATAVAPFSIRAESVWRWKCPELAAAARSVTVEPVKFGKSWAYALEFDDGGTFAQDIAVPILE